MRREKNLRFGLELLTAMLPPGLTGIEIGSYAGESADIFARSGKFKDLYCIDLWDPNYYGTGELVHAEKQFDQVKAKHSCIHKRKLDCNLVHQWAQDENIHADFIYIDGNHSEGQVEKDIKNAKLILVKHKTAYLAGHDYNNQKRPGVKEAVDKQLGFPHIIFCDMSWLKILEYPWT